MSACVVLNKRLLLFVLFAFLSLENSSITLKKLKIRHINVFLFFSFFCFQNINVDFSNSNFEFFESPKITYRFRGNRVKNRVKNKENDCKHCKF